jgi:hypothetical protein
MAATITGITPNYPDPELLQIDLTGIVPNETVIRPCTTQCGQLVIGGLAQEGTQGLHFEFDITIDYNCTCVPDNCETAYAYNCCYSTCFSHWGFNSWGWTNGPLSPRCRAYVFDIYAGAAQCDLWRGKKVGYLKVNYNGSTATVTYNMFYGHKITKTHLYIGSTPIPPNNKPGVPGQYPYHDDDATLVTDTKVIYVIPVNGGDIYIIAHAVVCR